MSDNMGPEGIDRRVAARMRRHAARRGPQDDSYDTVELRATLSQRIMRLSSRRRAAAMLPLAIATVAWFAVPGMAAGNVRPGDRSVGEINATGTFQLWSKFADAARGGYVGFDRNAAVAGYYRLNVGSAQVAAYGAGVARSHDRSDVLREATGAGVQISFVLSHNAPAARGAGALTDPAAEAAAVQLAIYNYTDASLGHPVIGTDGWVAPVVARARAIVADADANAAAWWNRQSTTPGATTQTAIVLIPVNNAADASLVYLKTLTQPASPTTTQGVARAAAVVGVADALVAVSDVVTTPAGEVGTALPLAACAPAQPAAGIGGPQVLAPGATVTYVAGFANQGTVPIGPSNLTVQVPDGFAIVSEQPSGDVTGQAVNYRIETLAPGQSETFQVTVTVPASAAAGQVKATAEVATTPQYDSASSSCTPVPADTVASTTSTISPVAGQVEGVAVGGPLTVGSPEFATPNTPTTGALGDALRDLIVGICLVTSGMIVLTGIRRNPHSVMLAAGSTAY